MTKTLEASIQELVDIMHFTEQVSEAIYGLFDESQIYQRVKEEFDKAGKYDEGFFLLNEDGTKLKLTEIRIARPEKIRFLEKATGMNFDRFTLDPNKSKVFQQVLSEGKTVHYRFKDLIKALMPKPVSYLIVKTFGFENVTGVITPLRRHGKIIGAFSMSAPNLAEYFAPSVISLASHISTALEMADEHSTRTKMEKALAENEEKYRAIVENLPIYVAIYQDESYRYVNRAMCEKLGWTFEEMTNPSFHPLVKTVPARFQQLVKENIARRLKENSIPLYEISMKCRDGSEIPVAVKAKNIIYEGKKAIEYIITDISERKQTEAEKLSAVSQMAKSIGHDLRNPLSSMKAAAYILKNEKLSNKGEKMLEIINLNITTTDRIIKEFLQFTLEPKLHVRETDINTLLKRILAQTIMPSRIKVLTNFGNIPTAEIDAEQLERALFNLVQNAVQAMPHRGELTVATATSDKLIRIKIGDTGIGIPEENLEKIFTPFFTTKPEGNGLGLSGAKRIVESHGGAIHIDSKKGRGTTITMELPITQSHKTRHISS
ncbi:MAG: ATP-binding protein [Thaumarchaeota archaeon]|nr:ATP-binding protein [Nitrososphaerota archaeon]MCL5318700.1 ATP-binding protein [Nitrososphaerota archaeon]